MQTLDVVRGVMAYMPPVTSAVTFSSKDARSLEVARTPTSLLPRVPRARPVALLMRLYVPSPLEHTAHFWLSVDRFAHWMMEVPGMSAEPRTSMTLPDPTIQAV